MRPRRRWVGIGIAIASGLAASLAMARVGGGESYGGSDSGGSGGSGGGGGEAIVELIYWMMYLTIKAPAIGIPLDLAVGVGVIYWYRNSQGSNRSSASAHALEQASQRAGATAAGLEKLRATDPYFSTHPFLDFVGLLYARFQEARGTGRFESLSAHLGPELLTRLRPPQGEATFPRLTAV